MGWGWLWAPERSVMRCQRAAPWLGRFCPPSRQRHRLHQLDQHCPPQLSWALPSVVPLDLQWVLGMTLGMSGLCSGWKLSASMASSLNSAP